MEIGVGIRGEPGRRRVKLTQVDNIAEQNGRRHAFALALFDVRRGRTDTPEA
jgi:hypothetical protein